MRDYGIASIPVFKYFQNPEKELENLKNKRLKVKKELLIHEDKDFLINYELISTAKLLDELGLNGKKIFEILNVKPCEEIKKTYQKVLNKYNKKALKQIASKERVNEKGLFIRFLYALKTALEYCGEYNEEEFTNQLIEPLKRGFFSVLLDGGVTFTSFFEVYKHLEKAVEVDRKVLMSRFSLITSWGFWLSRRDKHPNWRAYAKRLEEETAKVLSEIDNSKRLDDLEKKLLKFRILFNYKRLKESLDIPFSKSDWAKFDEFLTEFKELKEELSEELERIICSSGRNLLIENLLPPERVKTCVKETLKGKTLSEALGFPLFEKLFPKEAFRLKTLREKVLKAVDFPESFEEYKENLERFGLKHSPREVAIFEKWKTCKENFERLKEEIEFFRLSENWEMVLKLVEGFKEEFPECVGFYSEELQKLETKAKKELQNRSNIFEQLWKQKRLIELAKELNNFTLVRGSKAWDWREKLLRLFETSPFVETYFEGEKYFWVNCDRFTTGRVEKADFPIRNNFVPRVLYTFELVKGFSYFRMRRMGGAGKPAVAAINGKRYEVPYGEELKIELPTPKGQIEINDGIFINYNAAHPSGLFELEFEIDEKVWDSPYYREFVEDFKRNYAKRFLIGKLL